MMLAISGSRVQHSQHRFDEHSAQVLFFSRPLVKRIRMPILDAGLRWCLQPKRLLIVSDDNHAANNEGMLRFYEVVQASGGHLFAEGVHETETRTSLDDPRAHLRAAIVTLSLLLKSALISPHGPGEDAYTRHLISLLFREVLESVGARHRGGVLQGRCSVLLKATGAFGHPMSANLSETSMQPAPGLHFQL